MPHARRLGHARPNRRSATFSNIWAGRSLNTRRFRSRLTRAAEALRLAESGTVTDKVVLTP